MKETELFRYEIAQIVDNSCNFLNFSELMQSSKRSMKVSNIQKPID